jgi:hypothetical protein
MAKSASKSAASGKRTLIEPNGDKRYIRRNEKGQITESDDQGRSLSQDIKRTAKTKVKSGQGDKGDQAKTKAAAPKKGAAKKSAAKKTAASKKSTAGKKSASK